MHFGSYIEPSNANRLEFDSIQKHEKLKLLSQNTLQISEEDHTLMNLLQNVIIENRDVHCENNEVKNNKDEFICGYIIPHPSEELVEFKIVGDDFFDVFQRGLTDVEEMCLIAAERLITLKEDPVTHKDRYYPEL